MKIKNIELGGAIGASGMTNFYGNGYPYHSLLAIALFFTILWVPFLRLIRIFIMQREPVPKGPKGRLEQLIRVSNEIPIYPVIFSTSGAIHTTKTIVAEERKGNLKTEGDFMTPNELQPKCIYVDMVNKVAVNNVSLTCPGIQPILDSCKLQQLDEAFIISIMPVGDTPEKRLAEIKHIASALGEENFFSSPLLQVNVTCPNADHELDDYLHEVTRWANILKPLGMPITVKINVFTSLEAVRRLEKIFDAIFVSNSISYPLLTKQEKDTYFYGMEESPLMQYQDSFTVKGPGGVSGTVLLPRVLKYVRELKEAKVSIPVILGGGILSVADVYLAKAAGADAISPGSITMIAPWNTRAVIRAANKIFK